MELVPQSICPRCGRPASDDRLCFQCQTDPIQLDGVRSVAIHDGALRKAIHHLKYYGRRELVSTLGQMLCDYWQGANLPVDVVIPVPLHVSRLRERGFNQAGELARALARHVPLALNETHLVRTRATAPQVELGARERQANVQDAFAWTGGRLDGVRVLLIDDVCTTGATLEACGAALRQAGAELVWALTLARPR